MNNILDLLLQKTPDGATYLQTIIISIAIIFLIHYFFKAAEEIREEIRGGKSKDDI